MHKPQTKQTQRGSFEQNTTRANHNNAQLAPGFDAKFTNSENENY